MPTCTKKELELLSFKEKVHYMHCMFYALLGLELSG